jgi:hypothetical protein
MEEIRTGPRILEVDPGEGRCPQVRKSSGWIEHIETFFFISAMRGRRRRR